MYRRFNLFTAPICEQGYFGLTLVIHCLLVYPSQTIDITTVRLSER